MESTEATTHDRLATNRAVVQHEDDVAVARWDDPQHGTVEFRTLLGGDGPTGAFTVGVGEMAPGDRLGHHRHAPAEIYFVVEGEGQVTIDGTDHPVRAGSLVHVPGDAEHGVRNTGEERLRILYVLAATTFADVEYCFVEDDS